MIEDTILYELNQNGFDGQTVTIIKQYIDGGRKVLVYKWKHLVKRYYLVDVTE